MSDAKDSAKQSIKEKFFLQRQRIEELTARVAELEGLLAGPSVCEQSIQTSSDLIRLSRYSAEPTSFSPDILLASEKLHELEKITQSLQSELRKANDQLSESNNALDQSKKKIEQSENSNSSMRKEVDTLTSEKVKLQSQIHQLTADLSEKQSSIEKLQDNSRKLSLGQSEYESVLRERDELRSALEASKRNQSKLSSNLNEALEKAQSLQSALGQKEKEFSQKINEITSTLSTSIAREKALQSKLSSTEEAYRRQFQTISEAESSIASLQSENARITKECFKIQSELAISKSKEISIDDSPLRKQITQLRAESDSKSETISKLKAALESSEGKNKALTESIAKIKSTVFAALESTSEDQAIQKISDNNALLKQAQKEISDLRLQLSQAKSLRLDISEATQKAANLQTNLDFLEARMDYLRQLIIQLLSTPVPQRARISKVIADFLSFNSEEREAVAKFDGSSFSSRVLYALGPFG